MPPMSQVLCFPHPTVSTVVGDCGLSLKSFIYLGVLGGATSEPRFGP